MREHLAPRGCAPRWVLPQPQTLLLSVLLMLMLLLLLLLLYSVWPVVHPADLHRHLLWIHPTWQHTSLPHRP
jgi:hypothetical protein